MLHTKKEKSILHQTKLVHTPVMLLKSQMIAHPKTFQYQFEEEVLTTRGC